MKINKKELLKSFLLVALLFASLVQVGLLWSEINDGINIPFFIGSSANSSDNRIKTYNSELTKADMAAVILNPYRITVCDGGQYSQKTQKAHYPVSRKSELFTALKTRCRIFFEDILTVAPEPDLPVEQWGELVTGRGFLIEFRTPVPREIISWLIDRNNTTPDSPAEICKLLIIPEDKSGKQSVCLYVLTNNRIVPVFSPSSNYYDTQKMLNDSLLTLSGGANIRYMTIGEFGGGRFPDFSPDVFCVVDGPKTGEYKKIRYTAPTEARDKSELENIILSTDIYSYNRSIDYNDTLVFKNITSVYRLYKNGFMEYNYIPLTQPGEKGGIADALENAAVFILNIEKQLLGGADLILSGIYENESDLTYRFEFDYVADDYPVYFSLDQPALYEGPQNAINILANANRTVSCRWTLVDVYFGSDTKLMQIYFDQIDVGKSLTKMAVSDIAVAYTIPLTDFADFDNSTAGGAGTAWPVWAITSPDGTVETVDMSEG